MKRSHPAQNVSEAPLQTDSDEEEYSQMSTQKLKKMIAEDDLSQTSTKLILDIFVKKVDARDEKYIQDIKAGPSTATDVVPTSRLKAILEAVKGRISFRGKDEDLVQDPQFKAAMESLTKNPIRVVFKGVTLTTLWDKKRSRLGFKDPTNRSNNFKCLLDFCWMEEKSSLWNYCHSHCDKNVYFVRDIKADVITVAIFYPHTKKCNGYSNKDLNMYSKSKSAKTTAMSLYYYMDTHKDSKNDPHVAVLRSFANLVYTTEDLLAGEGNHHNMVAMSVMTMLYNSVCDKKDKVKFVNQEIFFRSGDGFQKDFFVKLGRVFEMNGFNFKITGEKKSTTVLPPSLHPLVSYDNLPSSYLARDTDTGEIYSGVKWGMTGGKGEGSNGHNKLKKTGLSDFDKNLIKRIYQFPHPKAQLIKDNNSYTRLTEEEKNVHDEMKEPAKRVETLGHMSSLLAEILGLKINGHDIVFLCQKYTHFDDSFSKSMFNDVFGYLYGEVLEVEIPSVVTDKDGNLTWKFVK